MEQRNVKWKILLERQLVAPAFIELAGNIVLAEHQVQARGAQFRQRRRRYGTAMRATGTHAVIQPKARTEEQEFGRGQARISNRPIAYGPRPCWRVRAHPPIRNFRASPVRLARSNHRRRPSRNKVTAASSPVSTIAASRKPASPASTR